MSKLNLFQRLSLSVSAALLLTVVFHLDVYAALLTAILAPFVLEYIGGDK